MASRETVFKFAGGLAAALAAVAAVSIIVAAVDYRPWGGLHSATHDLGEDTPLVWALLALLLADGIALTAVASRLRGAPAGDSLDNFFRTLEFCLLSAGFVSVLLLFLDGIRLLVSVTDAESLWRMFVLSMVLAILSGAKSRAVSRWLARNRATADNV